MFDALIKKRRTIRKFLPRPVEKEKIDALVEAGLRAPSSRSLFPWRFYFVTDPDLLEKLARAKPHGSAFLRGATLGVVVAGDPKRCDVWVEDCSIAATFLFLAAESLGLGACWIQIRLREHDPEQTASEYVVRLLDMEPGLEVASIIAIGYPDEAKPPHEKSSLLYEKVVFCD